MLRSEPRGLTHILCFIFRSENAKKVPRSRDQANDDRPRIRMVPAATESRRSIRPHHKSRTGCSVCKRRRVKVRPGTSLATDTCKSPLQAYSLCHRQCDEQRPCSNCISFGVTCDLAPEATLVERHRHDATVGAGAASGRGRGRPRKSWTASPGTSATGSPGIGSPSIASSTPPAGGADAADAVPISADHAELLAQFVMTTAETLAGQHSVMRAF